MTRKEMLLAARDNAEIARDARWLLPSLNQLGYNEMTLLAERIGEELDNIHYFVENGDETFTNAMDGEDSNEEEREFRFAFLELEAELERNCRYGRHDYEYMYIYGTAANAAVRRFDKLLEKLPDRF